MQELIGQWADMKNENEARSGYRIFLPAVGVLHGLANTGSVLPSARHHPKAWKGARYPSRVTIRCQCISNGLLKTNKYWYLQEWGEA